MSSSSEQKKIAAAITLSDVQYSYPRMNTPVLDIDSWHVDAGSRTFIYGPSGSGKTTLLNLLSGVTVPDKGKIEILGSVLSSKKSMQRDRFRAQHIGVIFQQFNLISWLSIRDNIAAACYFADKMKAKNTVEKRITDMLDKLGIAPSLLNRQAAKLSVGQQQRVAIARALINEPELIIADEPTSSLDSSARDDFIQLLLECVSLQSSTLIFVSHDQNLASHFDQQVDLQLLNTRAGAEVTC